MLPNLTAFADWLINLLLYVPRQIYSLFGDALESSINGIMDVINFSGVSTAWASIPGGVLYLAGWFHVGQGITTLLVAYTVRFLIRRLPVVG